MEGCRKYRETLLLDVYGELGARETADWNHHLEKCPGCREERRKMLRFLGRIKERTLVPELSPEKGSALSWAITRKLSSQKSKLPWWARLVPFSGRAFAAVAAGCCVVVLSGWLALKWFDAPFYGRSPSDKIELSRKEFEVISNLELLEELETLSKLVHVIDHKKAMSGSPQI
ncbi:MAG: hypothetical protein JW836_08820 [Deltaproteobacteria bacterium]|nr:hypothetical protein [Deltaproteobacteria bacterium]